jgi:hypothetical protein
MKKMIAFLMVLGLVAVYTADVFAAGGCCSGGGKAKDTATESTDSEE